MSRKFTCIAAPTSWNEDRSLTTLPRVTAAEVTLALTPPPGSSSSNGSDVDATTHSFYQMTYLPNTNASFVFTETVKAKNLLGKQGTFITQGKGTFESKTYAVKGTFEIVEGTGTEGFEGIAGGGSFGPAVETPTKLQYEFEMKGIAA